MFSKVEVILVGTARLELATSPLSEERSNQLSYAPGIWARINLGQILSKELCRFLVCEGTQQISAHPYQVDEVR